MLDFFTENKYVFNWRINIFSGGNFFQRITWLSVVSFAAVIRVVTQCSSPTNGCSLELYIPFLKLTNKDQASISWKPGPLSANVTRNMIGAAANSCMHVVGSQ